MDPNQCGGSNPVKDFSLLTLEDRSRYQDRVHGANGANAQSFRTGANNGTQANADFAGFQSGSSALPATLHPPFHQNPGHLLGANAQGSGFGHQLSQPIRGAGGNQNATAPLAGQASYHPYHYHPHSATTRVNHRPNLPQPPSLPLTHGQRFERAISHSPSQGNPTFQGPPRWEAQPGIQPYQFPASSNALSLASAQAPGFGGSAYAQDSFPGLPFADIHAYPQNPPPSMFHYGQSQGPPLPGIMTAAQIRQHAEQQQQIDQEFQTAMDDWMRDHGDITGSVDADTYIHNDHGDQSNAVGDAVSRSVLAQQGTHLSPEAEALGHFRERDLARDIPNTDASSMAADRSSSESKEASSDNTSPATQTELSLAAQKIIDSVADNDSLKFKNSAFLKMMRGLAEQEIVLFGKDFVQRETSAGPAGPAMVGSGSHVTGSMSGTRQDSNNVGNPGTEGNIKGDRKGKGKAVTIEEDNNKDGDDSFR